ncbi:uncharacterized protein LOC126317107 [Schistocerca gregaria]|uniref:uncharacterized protein LOC126317107 n=1 Tax=Schistocerca gregaria TaxID=7010 RepID=UPI00211EA4C9|nr:uncharacterized protein LOC126317107 [Schistocerca gregaria]
MSSRRRRPPGSVVPGSGAGANLQNVQPQSASQGYSQVVPQDPSFEPAQNQYPPYQVPPYFPPQGAPTEGSQLPHGSPSGRAASQLPYSSQSSGYHYPLPDQIPSADSLAQPGVQPDTYYQQHPAPQPSAAYSGSQCTELQMPSYSVEHIRLTLGAIPQSNELLNSSNLPLGIVIQPFSEAVPIETIDASGSTILRCRHCRAYINPFVRILERGRRWQCCICDYYNNLPDDYFLQDGPLPSDGPAQLDQMTQHLELNSCVVEYLTPASYVTRPPIPPTYLFLIDVSYYSVSTGVLQLVSDTLIRLIDKLPGGSRTKICIVAFDSKLMYFDFSGKSASMLVHTNVHDIFIPPGYRFLVECSENYQAIVDLLKLIPEMFQDTRDVQSCLGTALNVARTIMKPIGGKMLVFTGLMPTSASSDEMLGPGRLVNRFDPKSTEKNQESVLIRPQPDGKWYREFAVDCTKDQISIDLFLFDQKNYIDVATLSQLSTHTGGQVYYYPEWKPSTSSEKFCKDLEHNLLRTTAWEAVMRVRCSHGIRILTYLGNLFMRNTDLIAICTLDPEKAYGLRLALKKNLTNIERVYIQSALLYSNSAGERRVRVITITVPTASTLTDVFRYADCEAIVTLLGKLAIDKLPMTTLPATFESLTSLCAKVMSATQHTHMNKWTELPESLAAFPLLILALLKTHALRTSFVHPDLRSSTISVLQRISTDSFIQYLYPMLYQIYPLAPEFGLASQETQAVVLPPTLNLTCTNVNKKCIYLLCDGQEILVWFGSEVPEDLVEHLLGVMNARSPGSKYVSLRSSELADVTDRIRNILDELWRQKPYFQKATFVTESMPMSSKLFDALLEDRTRGLPSYHEFIRSLGDRSSKT